MMMDQDTEMTYNDDENGNQKPGKASLKESKQQHYALQPRDGKGSRAVQALKVGGKSIMKSQRIAHENVISMQSVPRVLNEFITIKS